MTKQKDFGGIDDAVWEKLAHAAIAARELAYAPYSKFAVGASLLGVNGQVFSGCNVENATYGATSCAERTAYGTAVQQGVLEFVALCVVTDVDEPAAPCGICRQVIAEFSDDLPIMMLAMNGSRKFATLNELLPHRFSGRDMENSNS